jgi:hypothetical protein
LTIFGDVGAADDRVVDQHDAPAGDDLPHGVELDLDAEVAIEFLGSMKVRPT